MFLTQKRVANSMSDHLNGSLEGRAIAKASSEQTVAVTIQLPLKFVKAIKQHASQSGQSHTEVILEALQQLLRTDRIEAHQSAETQLATLADLRELSARLSALEGLADRVEDLEGKWVAS